MPKKTESNVLEEHLKGLSAYNEKGEEIPDPRPLEMPVGFTRPIPLEEEIRRLVHNERVQQELDAAEMETFEEANDFNLPDQDMSSPFEENFDPHHTFAHEAEIRSGVVKQPDISRARELINQHATKKPAIASEPAKSTAKETA